MQFFVPQMLSVSGGISIISHADCLKFGILMDEAVTDHPKELMDIIEKELDVVLEGMNWRSYSAKPVKAN
jgi:hypothetical protein